MSLTPTTSSVPLVPVAVAGVAAQLADDAVYLLFPPAALLGFLSGLVAIALTAGAARVVTRGLHGAAVARTGLAVGAVSAVVGLVVGGLGLVAVLLAGITVVAGVAGAVARRRVAA
jgi:hypothetical protein